MCQEWWYRRPEAGSSMRVIVDFDRCDSTGLCTSIAPDLFVLDEEDRLQILTDRPDRACPKLAILLQDGG
jgi:ferredoxin